MFVRRAFRGAEVLLVADEVRLGQPCAKIGVDVAGFGESERVKVVTRRKGLNSTKSRVLETAGEHHVTVQPVLPRRHLGKRHPNLKSDPSLLRKNTNRPDCADLSDNLVEERADLRPLSAKVIGKFVSTARMRLIAIREVAPTLFAMPQSWLLFHRCATRTRMARLTFAITGGIGRRAIGALTKTVRVDGVVSPHVRLTCQGCRQNKGFVDFLARSHRLYSRGLCDLRAARRPVTTRDLRRTRNR